MLTHCNVSGCWWAEDPAASCVAWPSVYSDTRSVQPPDSLLSSQYSIYPPPFALVQHSLYSLCTLVLLLAFVRFSVEPLATAAFPVVVRPFLGNVYVSLLGLWFDVVCLFTVHLFVLTLTNVAFVWKGLTGPLILRTVDCLEPINYVSFKAVQTSSFVTI